MQTRYGSIITGCLAGIEVYSQGNGALGAQDSMVYYISPSKKSKEKITRLLILYTSNGYYTRASAYFRYLIESADHENFMFSEIRSQNLRV